MRDKKKERIKNKRMAQHPIIRPLESRMRCLSKMEIIKPRSQPLPGRTLYTPSQSKIDHLDELAFVLRFSSYGIGVSSRLLSLSFLHLFHSSFSYFISSLCVCMCVWKAINRRGFQQINHPRSVNGKFARMNPLTFLYRVVFACAPVPAKKYRRNVTRRILNRNFQVTFECRMCANNIQMGEDIDGRKEGGRVAVRTKLNKWPKVHWSVQLRIHLIIAIRFVSFSG